VPYITSTKTDGIAQPQVAPTAITREHQKKQKLQKIWRIFQHSKMWCNNTTLATQFPTLTPQKHHNESSTFSKSPQQNSLSTTHKKIRIHTAKS
jgi:hypothetical protein